MEAIMSNETGRRTDSIQNSSNFIPVEAAGELGLVIPEYVQEGCRHCGEPMQYVGMIHPYEKSRLWLVHPLNCECEGAEKERREILAREVEAKKEAVRRDLQRRLEKSNLGARFHDRTFENFKVNDLNRAAFESVKKYCDNFDHYKQSGKGIYLTGPYGTGKTHLAAGMVHELLQSCHSCIFGTAISLFGRIKSTYGNSKEDEAQVLNEYTSADLLIIDDLGKEKTSAWTIEQTYAIINQRYENYLPVVITSNYTLDELTKRLTADGDSSTAEAIASRLHEMCVGIFLKGDDYRKTAP